MLEYEPVLRLGAFAGTFLVMAALELALPRRKPEMDKLMRWPGNLTVMLLNTIAVRFVFPTAAVGWALQVEQSGQGLLNLLDLGTAATAIIAFVLLDLTIYWQHVAFHRIPLLWRLHSMHHTDNDLDVTSGARFHPLEILLSMLIKIVVITVLGAPAIAVLLFEVVLSSGAIFNHANFKLPLVIDRWLRLLIVTPDMHRVHHSVERQETDSNYGFNLSLWDRLFGSYKAQPAAGHEGMTIGLPETQTPSAQRIDRMLLRPFEQE